MVEGDESRRVLEEVRRSRAIVQKSIVVSEGGFEDEYTVERRGIGPLVTPYGKFRFYSFEVNDEWEKYSVLVKSPAYNNNYPTFDSARPLVVRIDSGCETGQVFTDLTCECVDQLYLALYEIALNGQGILINIPRQDGRGMGLPFKLATLEIQDVLGVDTVESSRMIEPNGERDRRTYGGAISVLKFLDVGHQRVTLSTNNPSKKAAFIDNGFEVDDLPSVIEPTQHTRAHLDAKQSELGHESLASHETVRREPDFLRRIAYSHYEAQSMFCCGLDPDLGKLPRDLLEEFDPSYATQTFLAGVVAETIDLVGAYKIQKAFFDRISGGHRALRETIKCIRLLNDSIPIFLDTKSGDIGNTMDAYRQLFFESLKVDAALVNPMMGTDVLDAFVGEDIGSLVLVRTSNPGAALFQDVRLEDGNPYWTLVLKEVLRRREQGQNLMPVIGGLSSEAWRVALEMLGDAPVFFAGAGAQAADLSVLGELSNGGRQVFVNSSRGILFPLEEDYESDWRSGVRERALNFHGELQSYREGGL